MWEKLRELVRGAPLLCLLLLMWLLLTVVSVFGRGRAYSAYSSQYGKIPGVSVVMRGLHDHVLPWSPAPGTADEEEEDGETEADGESGGEAGADDAAAENLPRSGEDGAEQTAGAGGIPEESSDSAQQENAGGKQVKDGAASSGNEAKDAAASSGNKAQDDAAATEKQAQDDAAADQGSGQPEDAAASGKEQSQDAAASAKGDGASAKADADPEKAGAGSAKDSTDKGDNPSEKDADSVKAAAVRVPETSGTRVVPAKDYGVADKEYLSDPDAVYNTDTEGLFAPNGTFYELQAVDDSYFDDALFIGDSRTVGLYEYGNMQLITSFLARESTTVYDLFDENEKMDYNPKGRKTMERTLKDLLSKAKFRKIYLSVGVNELGIPDTMDYYEEYRKVIRKIHKLQPEAVIYMQGIMHVSKSRSKSDAVFNNTAIVQRNQAISTLANGRNIFYIDMNADLCDADGNLRDELTGDGIHLKASACELWHAFLKKNAVVLPE
ncbi:MAG: GDSL-type esterase/lipase family protein [Eubacteriales bacterium]|nr:GDSL-type esterase/lipase family protein [Eubacteriales bacterium]